MLFRSAYQVTASDATQQSTGTVTHSGDLNIRGEIICQQTISALGNLTAGGHLSIQGSIMAQGMVPATGGEPLPHMITGIFPGLGLMVDTVGTIEIGSTMPIIIDSAMNTLITAPTNIINGVTAINGATSILGATAITGMTQITGILDVSGNILTQGDMIGASGATLDTHVHVVPGIMPGPSTTVTLPAVG